MKNNTSVAGTALAMPLRMNTVISRRNCACCHGSQTEPVAGAGVRPPAVSASASLFAGPAVGRKARCQPNQASASAAQNTAAVDGKPTKAGNTEAVTTPSSPSPSRQATMRLCCVSLPPSKAPQAWCATVRAL